MGMVTKTLSHMAVPESNPVGVICVHAVVSREQPTALAYMLLKVKVTADGVVKMVPNRRFSKMLEVRDLPTTLTPTKSVQ